VRNDLKASIEHQYKMGYLCAQTPYCVHEENPSIGVNLRILLTSPIRALQIALKRKHPNIIWAYPLLRLYQLNIALSWSKASGYAAPVKTSTSVERKTG
jgi:hypothetical protein